MKQRILGSSLARLALSTRSMMKLGGAVLNGKEVVETLVNDQLAEYLMVRFARPGTLFLDVGAHIGSIITEVLHYCPSTTIVAIEAIPEKVDQLRRTFPTITVHQCALGEAEGTASFFIHPQKSGYSSLQRPSHARQHEFQEIQVPLTTLDHLIKSESVDFIKIDVEGAELGVLRGGDRLISANRPTILFESMPEAENSLGYSKESLWQWFHDHSYEVVIPNRVAHTAPGLSLDCFLDSHWFPRRTGNYFGIPKERRNEVRARARTILKLDRS
ncbi:FkbM family methyltransferase [Tautonia rosea]|uniref:FkbM family methyltransferase n=1 Tax=Tautonia rosea TaxID=2728037 RepID=UPI0014743386|nr:FkbM family methyltransferase [Tautonia rosea]